MSLPAPDTRPCPPCKHLEQHLKPLIISMKILGLYLSPESEAAKSENNKFRRSASWWIGRVYSGLILLCLWFNFIRSIAGMFPFDGGLPLKGISCAWYAQCVLNTTLMLVACLKKDLLGCFYKTWDALFTDRTTQGIGCGFCPPKKFIRIGVVCSWLAMTMNTLTIYCFLFGNFALSDFLVSHMLSPLTYGWFSYVFAVSHIFQTGAWMFPLIFICTICRVIRAQFLIFTMALSKQIQNADGAIPKQLPELRFRYTELCQALDVFNRSFKWVIGASFLIEVFLACFVSYQLIQSQIEALSLATYLFWLVMTFAYIVILALSTSDVHEAAHSSLESIFQVGTKNATCEQFGQLYLFVSKLTGTSVGLTAVNFFVIRKEFLLTIGGLYVTYFFLLLQFKIT